MFSNVTHQNRTEIFFDPDGNEIGENHETCHCFIGEDHDADSMTIIGIDPDDHMPIGHVDERLSEVDAANIWRSSGSDPDFMFGYTEDELRRATGDS